MLFWIEGFQPGRAKENSPAIHRWAADWCGRVAQGRNNAKLKSVLHPARFFPSLRDSLPCRSCPSDKSLGYSRPSLWDFCKRLCGYGAPGDEWLAAFSTTQNTEKAKDSL